MAAKPATIRTMRHDDLDAVAELHALAFGRRDNSSQDIRSFYDVLLGRCLRVPGGEPPSVVAECDGMVVGMVIGAPVRALLDGESVTGTAGSLLATRPGHRTPSLSRRLVDELCDRSGTFLVADRVNRDGRRAAERSGLRFYPQYSLRWAMVLSPGRAVAAGILNRRTTVHPAVRRLMERVGGLADRAVTSTVRGIQGAPAARGSLRPRALTVRDLVEQGPGVLRDYRLTPDFSTTDTVAMSWKWLEQLRPEGRHVRTAVCRPDGEMVGWFVLHIWPTGVAEVVQLAARPEHDARVITALVHSADESGVVSLHGSVPPALILALGEAGAGFHTRSSATGIFSHDPAVHEAFESRTAYLTGLEGEYPVQLAPESNRRTG